MQWSPFPQWIKVYLPDADEFRMLFINDAYTKQWGISFDDYFMRRDIAVHPAAQALEYGRNDREVLELGPGGELTVKETARTASARDTETAIVGRAGVI